MEEEEAEEEEEKEEKRGRGWGGGGYSQLQSESNGPATITSAVIMNTLVACVFVLFFFSTVARGVGQPFRHGA